MSDLEKFKEVVDDVWEMVFGTERRPQSKEMMDAPPKRARTKGKFKADDKSTPDVNEAWVGGKAPTRVKTVGYKKRKKNVKS
tara:strand:+ start:320 stop:565 length:246 start_codon:yes stop_codon:yes gene_type:complete